MLNGERAGVFSLHRENKIYLWFVPSPPPLSLFFSFFFADNVFDNTCGGTFDFAVQDPTSAPGTSSPTAS